MHYNNFLLSCSLFPAYGCANPEFPPPETNMEFVDYINDTVVDFGGTVSYKCIDNHYPVSDHDLQTINATCKLDKSGTWEQPPWEMCILEEGEHAISWDPTEQISCGNVD